MIRIAADYIIKLQNKEGCIIMADNSFNNTVESLLRNGQLYHNKTVVGEAINIG